MLAHSGCRGTCKMLGSFLYLLFYTQQGPDLTLENFKARYLICFCSTPWNAHIKEDKRLKVKGMRGWKILVETLELSCSRAKVNWAAHCSLQLYSGMPQSLASSDFLLISSVVQRKGKKIVSITDTISTLHFAAFSMIFRVIIKNGT